MSSVEFLVKLRDAAQMMADAAEEYLSALAPADVDKHVWDPAKITWDLTEGAKGPYEKSSDVESSDFKALIEDLEKHNGKLTHDGFFYWKFDKSDAVGRKQRK